MISHKLLHVGEARASGVHNQKPKPVLGAFEPALVGRYGHSTIRLSLQIDSLGRPFWTPDLRACAMTSHLSLHPRTKELLHYLDSQREALRLAFERVPAALREQVPAPGCWSAAGVIEHLAMVEDGVNSRLKQRIQEACLERLGPELATDPVLPSLSLDHLFDRSTRIDAREAVSPTGLPSSAAWSALKRARDALRQTLIAADGLALGTVTMPHTRFGTQSAYYFFAFVGAHERRHAAQLDEIAGKFSRNG